MKRVKSKIDMHFELPTKIPCPMQAGKQGTFHLAGSEFITIDKT